MGVAYSLMVFPGSQTLYIRQSGQQRLTQSDRHADWHRDTWVCGQVAGRTEGLVRVDSQGRVRYNERDEVFRQPRCRTHCCYKRKGPMRPRGAKKKILNFTEYPSYCNFKPHLFSLNCSILFHFNFTIQLPDWLKGNNPTNRLASFILKKNGLIAL